MHISCIYIMSIIGFLVTTISFGAGSVKRHADDTHGCDDGKYGISIDLHGEKDWKCSENEHWVIDKNGRFDPQCYQPEGAYHVCIDQTIDDLYSSYIPHSGPHRKVWGQYGEYNYIPPGRYVHNLEHGGVVFMYHPCAPTDSVNSLRNVAKTCLYRYILTAFSKLTKEYPFAVITYGCVFRMSKIEPDRIKQWIRSQFGSSPESDVFGNGEYVYGLLVPSEEPLEHNVENSTFCPDIDSTREWSTRNPIGESLKNPEYNNDELGGVDLDYSHEEFHNLSNDYETQTEEPDTSRKSYFKISTTFGSVNIDPELPEVSHDEEVNTKEAIIGTSFKEQDLTFHNKTNETLFNQSKNRLVWIILSLICFVFGFVLGISTNYCFRKKVDQKLSPVRLWSDKQSSDSFSIAAVVRKIPKSFSTNRPSSDKYHRLEENAQSSDEESNPV